MSKLKFGNAIVDAVDISNNTDQIQERLIGQVITQAEYDALGDAVNTDGITYIVQG